MIQTLKQRVMFGVYAIYIIRKLRTPLLGELFIMTAFFAVLSFFVSLPNIFSNIILTRGSYDFLVDALTKTDLLVKLMLLPVAITSLFFIKNLSFYTTNYIKTRFV
ncbi:MAG: hypothetical protein WAX85_01080 [Minisyncoccia bacterium]